MSQWDAALYDKKHDFVAEYGKGLLEFVPENKVQRILDLGCGTGTLTAQFDVVFSNAVFHWIKDHDTLLQNVRKVLKPNGWLVCEFGAHESFSLERK